MEEYTRESLRELRKNEQFALQERREKGSRWITVLIIVLFLAAGSFYLATAKPDWLGNYFNVAAVNETVEGWQQDLATVFAPKEATDVQATVDAALAEQDA